ncbi:flavin reductase family protein [Rhizobium binae]|uniref:flavin reductase family protein n=1 Tax=Rhizobium binae TaxID=1138190 RepID=UPI00144225C2|nr:flavin reductase family protein [Rhizobium binae]NKL49478.1 flavin reductase [Rhizobium leguminosarum bv. viciae]MBX4937571.1 flavin reductase family protein [Rhizobium binae]MBX4944091.1 flavin reductase family protein [Rhizobium binae]MBX4960159.1 flavin reductase family protein [Rhizobium binae]MBX4969982.1 flavin reductase family protein [Rhizobium binae]
MSPEALISETDFKLSMRHLAGAVSVITVGGGQDRTGFTATSVSSFSAEVPSVIVSVNRASSSWPVLQRYGCFCVNVLAADQQQVAQSFAGFDGRKGVERFGNAGWYRLTSGAPVLENALTVLDCKLEAEFHHHSHAILIGHICAIQVRQGIGPLIYWRGGYRELPAEVDCHVLAEPLRQ